MNKLTIFKFFFKLDIRFKNRLILTPTCRGPFKART